MAAPDRAHDFRRVITGLDSAMDRIQEEKVGRAMATPEDSAKAGWSTNPEATLRDVKTVHSVGYDAPVSGAMLSSYRAEKGLPQ